MISGVQFSGYDVNGGGQQTIILDSGSRVVRVACHTTCGNGDKRVNVTAGFCLLPENARILAGLLNVYADAIEREEK